MSYQVHVEIPYEGTWVKDFDKWEDLVEDVQRQAGYKYSYSVYEITREIPIEEILG